MAKVKKYTCKTCKKIVGPAGCYGKDGKAQEGLFGTEPENGHQPNTCIFCCQCAHCQKMQEEEDNEVEVTGTVWVRIEVYLDVDKRLSPKEIAKRIAEASVLECGGHIESATVRIDSMYQGWGDDDDDGNIDHPAIGQKFDFDGDELDEEK